MSIRLPPSGPRLFFVHLMKTGGSSLLFQATENLREDEIWGPSFDTSLDIFQKLDTYSNVRKLWALSHWELRRIRFFMAHVPFCATEIPGPGVQTLSILRDPVERTLSYLKHCAKYHREHEGMSLEAIYEDEWYIPRYVENHQTKMFSMTLEEALWMPPPPPPLSPDELREVLAGEYLQTAKFGLSVVDAPVSRVLPMDDARLEVAKAALDRVDILGLHDEYDRCLDRIGAAMGWTIHKSIQANVGVEAEVPDSFRRRIAEDNAYDVELYRHAVELVRVQEAAAANG